MTDPKPWIKTTGDRSAFPCLAANYQPRNIEELVRDEIKQREEPRP